MIRASELIQWMKTHVGDGYAYGAAPGQVCTVNLLKILDSRWGKNGLCPAGLSEDYYHLNGDYTKGRCAKWLGIWSTDCSGFIKTGRKELEGVWKDVSAQGTYDQCTERGTIDTMPLVTGCAVFMWNQERKRIGHVGVYAGNNQVIEARGVKYGIVVSKLSERKWTHWGLLDWLIQDFPEETGQAAVGNEDDAGDSTNEKPGDIEQYREIIQKQVGFSYPEGIWEHVEKYTYAKDWYKKWAESYRK